MKKLTLALLAALTVVAVDLSAGYGYYRRGFNNCNSCNVCPQPCKSACIVDEKPIPQAPCCVRYVKVTEPAQLQKHVEYSWTCPETCVVEGASATNTMSAGQTLPVNY